MIRYLRSRPRRTDPRVRRIHREIRQRLGLLPEALTLHDPDPELLAASWSTLREVVVADGKVPRKLKEAMAIALSVANRCPYCVDAHGVMLHALGDGTAERALRRGAEVGDSTLAAATAWAAATRRAESRELRTFPFDPAERPEAIGTVACFHYINRMVTILLGESPLPLAGGPLHGPLLALTGRWLSRTARRRPPPDEAAASPPPGETPEHLDWARPSPPIHGAFVRFHATVEESAATLLTATARRHLRGYLAGWRGEEPPLGKEWLETATRGLAPAERPAGRLVLLTALAPHRVTQDDVEAFRRHHHEDAALLALLAWGGYEAARRVVAWLPGEAG